MSSISTFEEVIKQLVEEIEGLRSSINPLVLTSEFTNAFNGFTLNRFLEEHGDATPDPGASDGVSYKVRPEHFVRFNRIMRRLRGTAAVRAMLPASLFVALISRYDAFLGRLVRQMLLSRSELLRSSERSLTLGQLLDLETFESAKEFLIEKEIEAVLRRSHVDHFKWLENKIAVPLRKDLPAWTTFVELTERRNLLCHCDGIVSYQYLETCRAEGVDCSSVSVGAKLDVSPEYFTEACDCILEIAIKLTHVIWRKLLPNDHESAEDALVQTCFELLVNEHYQVACDVLTFAKDVLKRYASERHRLIYLVNLAQTWKWLKYQKKCVELLKLEDWSAKSPDFQICVAVLSDDFEEAAALMRRMGSKGPITAADYREWPVFQLARKEASFLEAYKEVFGQEMIRIDDGVATARGNIREFIESFVQRDEPTDEVPSEIGGGQGSGI